MANITDSLSSEQYRSLLIIDEAIRVKNALSMDGLRQLQAIFPSIIDFFAGTMGISPQEFKSLVEKGEIESDRTVRLMQELWIYRAEHLPLANQSKFVKVEWAKIESQRIR